MASQNHPLPPPPAASQQRPSQHRAKTSFSFRSAHSHKSSGSVPKINLHETHEEKQAKRLHSKADPSLAMNEAEPSEVANQANKLPSIRDLQHFDKQGNPIADPDRSNPTRSRWERPLDTIRAFEEAIDGKYSRTSARNGTDSADTASQFNRRSSYYAGSQAGQEDRSRFPQNGYHGGGGRSQSYRTDSYVEGRSNGMARPDSYYHMNDNAGPPNGPGYYNPSRARYPRTASEPHFNNGQGVYPGPGNQHSYETVTTASGSGSSPDTMGYSTDPSSENSSVDRYGPPQQKEPMDNYGFNGFGGNAPIQPPGYNINEQQQYYGSNGTQQQSYGQPPQVPRKEHPESRVPIKLGAGENGGSPSPGEKRKSWFGKRFSKNS